MKDEMLDNSPFIFIKGGIENEDIDKLIEKLSVIPTSDMITTVYFSCEGGPDIYAEVVIDILNNNKNLVELVAYGVLASNGLEIFRNFKGKKKLLPTVLGMIHNGDFPMSIRNSMNKFSEEVLLKEYIEIKNKKVISYYSKFLTKEELEVIEKGGDVWLNYERLKEIFKV